MESTTYLLMDENGKEHGIISGDTLFLSLLKINPKDINSISEIPFLPVSFFKSNENRIFILCLDAQSHADIR